MLDKIKKIKEEYDEILANLSKPDIMTDQDNFTILAKRKARHEEILNLYNQNQNLEKQINEAKELINDPLLAEEAQKEIHELERKNNEVLRILEEKLNPADPNDIKDVILEIRAGAGGEEAALFAADLFRMYSRYSERRGWKINLLDTSRTGIGGLKEVIFEVNGDDVYKSLKYESGVHRVQRIPNTEKMGRIHTSTASVAVLPQAEEVEIKIKPEEIRIDVFRSSGPGGQSVNTTDSAVRITHLPTGLVVSCQDQKSQLKNKEKAITILKSRLLAMKEEEEAKTRGAERRSQIGNADRSEKIRTYNIPQDRVTDHRIKKSWHGIENILDGNIEEIINELQENLKKER